MICKKIIPPKLGDLFLIKNMGSMGGHNLWALPGRNAFKDTKRWKISAGSFNELKEK